MKTREKRKEVSVLKKENSVLNRERGIGTVDRFGRNGLICNCGVEISGRGFLFWRQVRKEERRGVGLEGMPWHEIYVGFFG
jgi:hypothetical protein